MAIPVATALIDGVHVKTYEYEALGAGLPITLTGAATNGPILAWEWSIIATDPDIAGGVPEGSSLTVGVHGDFTNGKATVQNPTITLDAPGGYCFSLRAQNGDNWSDPSLAKNGEYQAIIYIKTLHGVKQPPANQKRYQDDLNQGLQRLEALAAGVAATGVSVDMFSQVAGGTYIVSDTVNFQPFDLSFSQTFTAPTAGRYLLSVAGTIYGSGGSGGGRIRLKFDAGAANEQVVGNDDNSWSLQGSSNFHEAGAWFASVELSAGTHTLRPECKRIAIYGGSSPAVDANSSWLIQGTLVTGSGAGGTLLSYKEDIVDRANSTPGTPLELTALETPFSLVDGEDVSATLHMFTIKSGGTYPDTCNVSYKIDDGPWVLTYRHWIQAAAYPGDVSLAFPLTGLSEGPHTIKWGIHVDGSGTITVANSSIPSKSAVWQFRGGLVPVESDGTVVTDKPRALNFVGAGVSVTDTDGTADIQLNEAITALGSGLQASATPAGTAINSTSWVEFMSSTIVPEVAGKHAVDLGFETINQAFNLNENFEFKVVFDEGGVDEVTLGGDATWGHRQVNETSAAGNEAYHQHFFTGFGTLAAKSQTVKVYGRRVGASTTEITVAGYRDITVTIQAVTGSGAGGVLADEKHLTSNYAYTNTGYEAIDNGGGDDLRLTFETSEGEDVLVMLAIRAFMDGSNKTAVLRLNVDGTENTEWLAFSQVSSVPGWPALTLSVPLTGLSAGTHTVIPEVSWTSTGTVYAAGSGIGLMRFRGGLVPIRKDGAMVLDKPAAVDYVGPSTQVTNVG
ncbi:MAG: hypothetical protein ACYTF8_00865, partial [Planctomycetota bacterium]